MTDPEQVADAFDVWWEANQPGWCEPLTIGLEAEAAAKRLARDAWLAGRVDLVAAVTIKHLGPAGVRALTQGPGPESPFSDDPPS
jgi:hypothetical protein